jgi:hypothetical protein
MKDVNTRKNWVKDSTLVLFPLLHMNIQLSQREVFFQIHMMKFLMNCLKTINKKKTTF